MIKPARKVDENIVVLLIHQAIGDLVNLFTASWDMRKALSIMTELYNTEKTRFSMEYSRVMMKQDIVVGQVIAYPAEEMHMLNENMLKVAESHYAGPEDELYLLKDQILSSKEAFEGEYYIDNLAVMPAFRGQGIGAALIGQVEEEAKQKGFKKVSILADKKNTRAHALYAKLGYMEDKTLNILGHSFSHLVKEI